MSVQTPLKSEVIFLDDSLDLRDLVTIYLTHRLNVLCTAYSSMDEMKADESVVLQSRVAILDIELGAGKPNGVDVYRWLNEKGYAGKIFFLTGHGSMHPLVKEALGLEASILEKPISGERILEEIRPFLNAQPRKSRK